MSKDDNNSTISSSDTSKNDNQEKEGDALKDKEKKTDEKSDKKVDENKEQIKLMSPSELHQKVKSIDWVSWIIKFFRILVIIMIARAVWKVLKITIEKHLNKLLVFHRKKSTDVENSPLFKTIVPINPSSGLTSMSIG